ncbi:MAG: ATP-binding cassette domain-containing protein [Lachnospiraceae bacterium]|jgi:ATP-binding cassette subfamily B multidrug efflux pump|nr:ATP-binding cassette domain-containing protein [Lachnospiraceae bacterium]
MLRILKYLRESKASVAAIILLLIVQAYGDLALPNYTSVIVDVGIQQGGIERAVPEAIREAELEKLMFLMTEEERELTKACYRRLSEDTLEKKEYEKYCKTYPALREGALYLLDTKDEETLLRLEEGFSFPMILITSAAADMDEAMKTVESLPDEMIEELRRPVREQMGDLTDSLISQRAVLYVRGEYEAIGMDLGKLQTSYLMKTGAAMLGISILIMGTAILIGYLSARTAAGVGMRLRQRVFGRVVSFSHAELDRFSTASLITRSTNDIQQVQMVSVMLLRMVAYAPILGIGGILKVMNTKTGMGWIIGVAVGAVVSLVLILMKVAMPKFRKMQELVDRLNLVAREILTGLPVIRAFSREKYEEKRFDKANRDLYDTQLFTNRVMTFMNPVMMLIMNGITVLIVWVGAQRIDMGNLQVGDMIAFITYTMQIVSSFLMLTMVSIMLPRAGVAARRIDEILDTEPVIEDAVPGEQVRRKKEDWKGEVMFHDVSFRYPGADENALEEIAFCASPGKTTAIIGSTGCGKSTLLNLIPRFYDVTKGSITIDGVDIRKIPQKELRELLGYVPQKGVLFSGTIESNLKFGGEEITDEEMKEAAGIAQAVEFIEGKPEGYESPIAQGGTNVSGGQKQRLSIARAIAKDPRVYLFDDSFSALDYKTDVTLRRALAARTADAAVIIVAQRISTILHADQIIVLDDGRIAGIGTHEELLRSCGAYQEIAKSQLSEEELKNSAMDAQKGGSGNE